MGDQGAEAGKPKAPSLTAIASELRNLIYDCAINNLLLNTPRQLDLLDLSQYKHIVAITQVCQQLRNETSELFRHAMKKLCKTRKLYLVVDDETVSDLGKRLQVLTQLEKMPCWPVRKIETRTKIATTAQQPVQQGPPQAFIQAATQAFQFTREVDIDMRITLRINLSKAGKVDCRMMARAEGGASNLILPVTKGYLELRSEAASIHLELMAKFGDFSLLSEDGKRLD